MLGPNMVSVGGFGGALLCYVNIKLTTSLLRIHRARKVQVALQS